MMHAARSLTQRIKNVVKVATLVAVNDTTAVRRAFIKYMGRTRLPAAMFSPYGLMHNPPANSLCLVFAQNGQSSNPWVMADDPRRRPLNLDPGEVAVGNYLTGDYVHFKADGSVVVQTAGAVTVNAGSVAINADTTINGDLTVTGDVSAQNATIAQTTTTGTIVFTQTGQTINVDGDIIVVNGDVTADGISLKTHVHSGVTSGGSNTGAPVP